MIRPTLVTFLLFASTGAFATADFEGHRLSTSVAYRDGSRVSVDCEVVDRCGLTLQKGSKKWLVAEDGFRGLVLVPSELALVGPERNGRFVVEVEVGCKEYAEFPPSYICLAQFTIEDAKVVDAMVFKRTMKDSWDAEPFIDR